MKWLGIVLAILTFGMLLFICFAVNCLARVSYFGKTI